VFDISFSELLVISVVALVVIGPEKLPKVARTAGAFFGRLQRFVTQVKEEVNRETRFAELQTLQQEVQSGLQQSYDEIEHSILPVEPPPAALVDAEVTSETKKPRKPRQRKTAVADEAAAAAGTEQPVLDADPQAQLFAVADSPKRPRRPRNTAKKAAAVSDAEQNPLA
jgi:sec-independent protein translocase protein TatB